MREGWKDQACLVASPGKLREPLRRRCRSSLTLAIPYMHRCRYSRLPRIRKLLGCPEPPRDPDSRLVVEDDEWLTVKITTSWIGGAESGSPGQGGNLDGTVLAFFHATEGERELLAAL